MAIVEECPGQMSFDELEQCPECLGTGYVQCEYCDGEGVIDDERR